MRAIIKNIALSVKVVKSYFKVRGIIKEFKPDFVIGTGGYSCAIPLYVAIKNKISTAIQEQNVLPGMVTRKFANKVDIVFISFSETKEYLKKENYFLTGNPIRSIIKNIDSRESKIHMGLDPDKNTILIMGGSQGSKSINEYFLKNYRKYLDEDIQFLWQTGKSCKERIKQITDSNIKKYEFIDDMDYAYSAADLVISRAGATAISEILHLGKPSILIPYPYAADNHQELNAKVLDGNKASIMVMEHELVDGVLENSIFKIIKSTETMNLFRNNALKYSIKDSSLLIKEKLAGIMLDVR